MSGWSAAVCHDLSMASPSARLQALILRPLRKMQHSYVPTLVHGDWCVLLQWQIDAVPPPRLLQTLKELLVSHAAQRAGEFAAAPSCSYTGAADPMKVQLAISYELAHNGVDGARAGQAKSQLIEAVTVALDAAGVLCSQAPGAPEQAERKVHG